MKWKRNDLILIITVLLAACAFYGLRLFLSRDGSGTVEVYRNKALIASYSLSEDREEVLSYDGHFNILVIRDGEAFIRDADCPDRLCVNQGRIYADGQSLICLPHRLTVTIQGGKEPELDAVVQ
ncbi:MAG: NusG domain II-containing protein [Lachnospiraceae bacterium]